MVGDVRNGKADLAAIATRVFDEVGVTSFEPLAAPLLIDSSDLERRVLGGDVGRRALTGLEPIGLVGLGLLPTELRRPLGITHVLRDPADYRDLMVYTREGRVARASLEALGAAPVHKGSDVWTESVDAAEIGLRALSEMGEAARYYSGLTANVVLWPQPVAIVIRRATFERLSDAQRQALRDAARDVLDDVTGQADASEAEALNDICEIGVKLVRAGPAQVSALRADLEPIYTAIERAPGNREAIARIRALKADARAATLSCNPARVSSGTADRQLDGTYRTRFSEDDLARRVVDLNQIQGQNWGEFTLWLAGGKFRLTQRNAYTRTVRSGTYSVEGDRIQVTFDDLGQTSAMRWTLFRGTLRFEAGAKGRGEPALWVRPFKRVS